MRGRLDPARAISSDRVEFTCHGLARDLRRSRACRLRRPSNVDRRVAVGRSAAAAAFMESLKKPAVRLRSLCVMQIANQGDHRRGRQRQVVCARRPPLSESGPRRLADEMDQSRGFGPPINRAARPTKAAPTDDGVTFFDLSGQSQVTNSFVGDASKWLDWQEFRGPVAMGGGRSVHRNSPAKRPARASVEMPWVRMAAAISCQMAFSVRQFLRPM